MKKKIESTKIETLARRSMKKRIGPTPAAPGTTVSESGMFPSLYWVLPSFTQFYRVLLGCIARIASCIGFYWIVLGFT